MDMFNFFLVWCIFAVPIGWVFATLESKVNGTPPRTRNAILWSVFGGVVGWGVVMFRSNLKFASGMRADMRAQGDLARQKLARNDAIEQTNPPPGQPGLT